MSGCAFKLDVVDTQTAAVVVAGVVGFGVPALNVYAERLRAQRGRDATEFDELRALLDDLTAAMFEHTERLVELEYRYQATSTTGTLVKGALGETRDAVSASRRRLYALNARLNIRRGRRDVLVTALGKYLEAVDRAMAGVDDMQLAGEPFDVSFQQLAERASVYWGAYESFIDRCHGVVASRPEGRHEIARQAA